MIKEAKILTCKFTNEWTAPNGDTIYYHAITLSNGEVGNIGSAEKNPSKLKKGQKINYTIDGAKIKLQSLDPPPSSHNRQGALIPPHNPAATPAPKKQWKKNPQDAITFILGYAANRHVALITSTKKDIPLETMLKDADTIYNHYLSMLNKTINE